MAPPDLQLPAANPETAHHFLSAMSAPMIQTVLGVPAAVAGYFVANRGAFTVKPINTMEEAYETLNDLVEGSAPPFTVGPVRELRRRWPHIQGMLRANAGVTLRLKPLHGALPGAYRP